MTESILFLKEIFKARYYGQFVNCWPQRERENAELIYNITIAFRICNDCF